MIKESMKTIILLLVTTVCFGQGTRHITISCDASNSVFFDNAYKADAIKAFELVNEVFNSEEFQQEIGKMNFDCESYCDGCQDSKSRISGDEVLNKLFGKPEVVLKLILEKRGSALGATSKNATTTTAWYKNIVDDMPELPFAYALAANLCHEYMHTVGFCHIYCTGWRCSKDKRLRESGGKPDAKFIKDDVTYKVGWLAYYILLDKHKQKKR